MEYLKGLSNELYIQNNIFFKREQYVCGMIKSVIVDECGEYLMPKDIIKVSIKEEKNSDKIYTLNGLDNGTLKKDSIKGHGEKNYTIRVWVGTNTLTTGTNLHYHGKIKVEEEK